MNRIDGMNDADNPIDKVFQRAKEERRATLIGYWPAGFPDLATSKSMVRAMAAGGCDIVEVGIPFSDPSMDGPIIETAARQALSQGTGIREVLEVVETISSTSTIPIVMSYYNPLYRYGIERFAHDLAQAGGQGAITPDLIVDEAREWINAAQQYDLSRIFLVAPSSTPQRLAHTTAQCTGFVYAASIMGVTGMRAEVATTAQDLVRSTRKYTNLPIAVGLGVKSPAQAAEIAQYADGVIVGSAFVALAQSGESAVRELAEQLARGVRRVDNSLKRSLHGTIL